MTGKTWGSTSVVFILQFPSSQIPLSLSPSLSLSLSLSHIMVLDWSPLSSKSDARGPQIALPGYRLKMEKETSSLIVFEIKL